MPRKPDFSNIGLSSFGVRSNLMLSHTDRSAINGALFKLDKRVKKPDRAMNDEVLGTRLWDELVLLTGLTDR